VIGVLAVEAIGASAAFVALRAAARDDVNRFRAVAVLSFASLAGIQLAVAGFDTFSRMRSASAILHDAQAASPMAADAPFYQVKMYDQTVPFYLGRTTRVVAYRDELALGIDAEPRKQVPTTEQWAAEWRALAQGYAIMAPDTYRMLVAEGIPMRELAADVRRVVVSRQ
jgi:aminoarabinose transferase-like protein